MSPGVRHEIPLDMIHRRPTFVLELLAVALGVDTSEYGDVRVETIELNSIQPTERAADSVTSVSIPQGDGRRLYVIVEVQLKYDAAKWWRWCSYVGTLMGRREQPVILVVICPEPAVAAGYDQAFQPDHSCLILRPVVVGPERLLHMVEAEDVLASPEMATLAAVARPNLEDSLAVARTLVTMSDERGPLYYSYLAACLPGPIREELEKQMAVTFELIDNEFTRRWEAQGRAKGKAEGKEEGKAEGLAESVLTLLEVRGFVLGEEQCATVMACKEVDQLKVWLTRAATATELDEVLGDA
ncbi:hypothetical protein ACIBG7_23605 [Nonomuraea sp. NPDC050328]|uniref:hypothetical protein n=1 Tax=Nonomuraea sp. NPDC050328 TaxID=3364361 RepID=UPI00378F2BA2